MTTAEVKAMAALHPQKKKSFGRWFREVGWRHLVAWVVILYAIFPILYILSTSLSNDGSIQNGTLFGAFNLSNYAELFTSKDYPFLTWAWNTVYIASIVAVVSVFMSALAAYAFSRLRFAGRRVGLLSLILIQMFPSILGLVAIFGMLSTLTDFLPAIGLGTHAGLILVYLGGSLGAGTYLMYGFFNTVPIEIDEAARMDGASHAQIFFTIILRLVAPILAVMALLSFIGTTSDFVLASIVLEKQESLTLAVGLGGLIGNPFSKDWAMFSAGAVLAATPIVILFIALQKYIVSGLVGGAVKG
ncbi:sugar ABC transporter permease [Rhodoluna sp.]|uniref:sugar ABC transporter permease n=1 Tax=Rhodoluna sp. TaxID=1969481 RepID=UPI0025DFCDAC|nr:sugar ABC transporter permease [Rhodoluna sp.]